MRRLLLVLSVASLTCGVSQAALFNNSEWPFDSAGDLVGGVPGSDATTTLYSTGTWGGSGTGYGASGDSLLMVDGNYFYLQFARGTSGDENSITVTYQVKASSANLSAMWEYEFKIGGNWETSYHDGFTDYMPNDNTYHQWSDNFAIPAGVTDVRFKVTAQVPEAGALSFDDITLAGSVPEPVNVALALFGVLAVGGTAGYRFLVSRKAKAA